MPRNFKQVITELWAELGLPPVRFGAENRVVLRVDDLDVALSEAPDGISLFISAQGGPLVRDRHARQSQVRDILHLALSQLCVSSACICLEQDSDDNGELKVQSRHLYSFHTGKLVDAIQEVVALHESLVRRLDDGGHRSSAASRPRSDERWDSHPVSQLLPP